MKAASTGKVLAALVIVAFAVVAWQQRDTRERPTEQDFLDSVHAHAGEGARDCGLFRRGQSLEPAIPCVAAALDAAESFFVVHYGLGIDSVVIEGLAFDGSLPAWRFSYDSDRSGGGRNPGDSVLRRHACPDPRLRKMPRMDAWTIDCGPRPSWLDYQDAVEAVTGEDPIDCGLAAGYSLQKIDAAVQCAEQALSAGTAFTFRFNTQVDDETLADRVLVSGPGSRYPQLFWFQGQYSEETPFKAIVVQRDCPSPRIRVTDPLHGRFQRNRGVEVDCG